MSALAASQPEAPRPLLTGKEIWRMWLPLAASWLLMGAELPLLSAVIARLPDPEIHLAAYGGVVFPIALLIEAPIIMLLAASTALSRDWASYAKLRRFMNVSGGTLTLVHIAVAFTPLYDLVAVHLIGAPSEIIEPARIGLMFMTPWTWAIAYRRFNQGVLIRFGHSRDVSMGTLIRLLSGATVMGIGYALQTVPGVIVATAAVSIAVLCEAGYVRARVTPVLEEKVRTAPVVHPPLTRAGFLRFYTPLALTALISLMVQPVLTAAISRMPSAVASLAVWPALNGLIFMLRSTGLAYNEVVIALLGRPGGFEALRRFTHRLAWILSAGLVLVAASPVAGFWFGSVAGLSPALAPLAIHALWAAVLTPAIGVMASWYQGILVHTHHTRPITESVLLFLVTSGLLLGAAVTWGGWEGLFAGMISLTLGGFVQIAWQHCRSLGDQKALANPPGEP